MITEASTDTLDVKSPRRFDGEDDDLDRRETHTPGALLDLSEKKAVGLLSRMWEAHEPYMKRRLATWRVNDLRRQGIPGVALVKGAGTDGWDVWLAPGISGPDHVPIPNKAAEIARKFVAILLADPPKPLVMPAGASEREVLAAQVATRVLEQVEGESMLSEEHTIRRAFNKASTFASAFVHYYVDPAGGPSVPIEIEAHPLATTEENALIDPMTGADASPPYVKKFVMDGEDGLLTDDPALAEMKDLPMLKREILTGRNVRFVPHTSEDIWDAEGVLVGVFMPLVKLRSRFPEVIEKLEKDKEKLQKVISYRPNNARAVAMKGQDLAVPDMEQGEGHDEAMVFVLTGYFRKSADYKKGAVVITLGKEVLAHRQEWVFERDDGVEEVLEIPITQYAQFDEGDDEPYAHALMEIIGRANEMRNAQASAIVELIERMANRKVFLPHSSMLNEEDLENPNKRYLPIADGQQPHYEQLPNIPQDMWHFFGEVGTEMDRAPGLSETVQGLETSSVKSGRQALSIVQQAHAALSVVKGNITRGYERGGRIKLQLLRAFFKSPHNFSFDEDESFKLDSWRGSDLGTSRDVIMAPGSGTMLTPAAKAQLAEHWFAMGLIPPDDMQRISAANIGPILGMQTDPFRTRVQRQINEWLKGPPENWAPPQPIPQMNPETGQMEMLPAPDPLLMQIFEPVPADSMPAVAQIRLTEISRLQAGERYMNKPREWRMGVDMEFSRMMMAVLGQGPNPAMSQPDQAQAMAQSGSPAQQGQAGDMLGMDQDPNANSSERLSAGEQAMAGGGGNVMF